MIFGFLAARAFQRYMINECFRSNNFQLLLYLKVCLKVVLYLNYEEITVRYAKYLLTLQNSLGSSLASVGGR